MSRNLENKFNVPLGFYFKLRDNSIKNSKFSKTFKIFDLLIILKKDNIFGW